jgi:glucokinase
LVINLVSLPSLGIDVGGGSAKIGIVAPDGAILARCRVESDPRLSAAELLNKYVVACAELQSEISLPRLAGIGIGLPGNIYFEAGTTRRCNVVAFNDFPVIEYLNKGLGIPTFIENDATLAALGEYTFGVGQGSNRFLTVAIGTGIGIGFIENGLPVHTSNGTMGDIGHVIVDPEGTLACRQGCHGCLESVASGIALSQKFEELNAIRSGGAPEKPDEKDGSLALLFDNARRGDPECGRIVEDAARHIAAGIVSWVHIFAPDRIALAGGLSAGGSTFLNRIAAQANALAMPGYISEDMFRLAALGNSAGLVGAATLGRGQHSTERAGT